MTPLRIHPTAVVAPQARLDEGVEVGPYAIIGPQVRLGRDTRVGAHTVIEGRTTIGAANVIFHHASLGAPPQDLKYRGEDSELVIGDHNTIREFTTLHLGTEGGGMVTRVGSHNLLMNYTHVAHDCIVGDHNIVANGTQLAGHVTLTDYCIVGALSGIHQFARIGESAMIGAGSMVSQDVAPFCNATGDRAKLYGLNSIGLKRRGFTAEHLRNLKQAYKIMFESKLQVAAAAQQIRQELPGIPEVERFVAFIETSERGVVR